MVVFLEHRTTGCYWQSDREALSPLNDASTACRYGHPKAAFTLSADAFASIVAWMSPQLIWNLFQCDISLSYVIQTKPWGSCSESWPLLSAKLWKDPKLKKLRQHFSSSWKIFTFKGRSCTFLSVTGTWTWFTQIYSEKISCVAETYTPELI